MKKNLEENIFNDSENEEEEVGEVDNVVIEYKKKKNPNVKIPLNESGDDNTKSPPTNTALPLYQDETREKTVNLSSKKRSSKSAKLRK